MEVFVVPEFLAAESGPSRRPRRPRSIRLPPPPASGRSRPLSRSWRRIGKAREQRQQDEDYDGGTNFTKHCVLLYCSSLQGALRRTIPFFVSGHGLLRGACHRAASVGRPVGCNDLGGFMPEGRAVTIKINRLDAEKGMMMPPVLDQSGLRLSRRRRRWRGTPRPLR